MARFTEGLTLTLWAVLRFSQFQFFNPPASLVEKSPAYAYVTSNDPSDVTQGQVTGCFLPQGDMMGQCACSALSDSMLPHGL